MRAPGLGISTFAGSGYGERRLRFVESLALPRNAVVLDFGCGDGVLTEKMRGRWVVGVDVKGEDVVRFKRRVRYNPRFAATAYAGRELPFPSDLFDVVYSWDVLEHVEDVNLALNEWGRVLKYGGHLVISVPNKLWVFETHGLWSFPYRTPFVTWLPTFIHERIARARVYSKRRIRHLLESHGFCIAKMEYLTAPMDVVRPKWLRAFLRRTLFKSDTTRWGVLATAILVYGRLR